MELILGIIGTIATVTATYFGWIGYRKDKSNRKKNGKSNRFKEIMSNKVIRIGYLDYPPLVSKTEENLSPNGVYPKIIELIAEKNQLEIEWNLINLSDAVNSIIDNKIDVFISIFQTPKRNKKAKFISFLHSLEISGIVKKGFPRINSIRGLKKKQLKYVVCKESVGEDILNNILKIPKSHKSIIDTNKISSIVSFVQTDVADIALADSLVCHEYMKNNSNSELRLIRFKPPIAVYNIGFMVAESDIKFSNWLEKEIELVITQDSFIEYEKEQIKEFVKVINKIR